jgi:hypothetical protein
MSQHFDDLSRAMAGPHSRRSMLKLLGGTAVAAVGATVLKPFRADAAACGGPTNVPCGKGTTPCGPCCCQAGVQCVNRSTGQCGCPAGTTQCGNTCCKAGVACKDPKTGTCNGASAACLNGTAACASGCCNPGIPCINNVCGCPSGQKPCGGVCASCPTNGGQCSGQTCVCSTGTTNNSGTCSARAASICASSGDDCHTFGSTVSCPGHPACVCTTTTEGGHICVGQFDCSADCNSSNDCPFGTVCVAARGSLCCSLGRTNACAPPCGETF